jgi:hypothetical protein
MKIVADETTRTYIRDRGGDVWVWLDPHGGMGGPALIYLDAAMERPGASKATSRKRSARRSHRFTEFPADGFGLRCDFGKFDPPEELHLVARRFPARLEAFWNGAIFVTDDLPES